MHTLICFFTAFTLSATTPTIISTGEIDEAPSLMVIHEKKMSTIDWNDIEKKGQRVQHIGGAVLVLVQIGVYIGLAVAGVK